MFFLWSTKHIEKVDVQSVVSIHAGASVCSPVEQMCGHTASPKVLAFHSMSDIFSRRATISECSTALVFLRCGPRSGCGVDLVCLLVVSLHPENACFHVVSRDFTPPQTMFYVIHPPEKYVSRYVTLACFA